jgi:hypothetical protein
MKVLAGLITQGTGSIGGMTMSKNRAGYYLRARVVPSNPRTPQQSAIRQGLSGLSQTWQALTAAQQSAWGTYAKEVPVILDNGQTKLLSGFNWYLGSNQLRLQAGLDVVKNAPTIFTLAGTPQVANVRYVDATTLQVDVSVLDNASVTGNADTLMFFVGRPQTLGTAYFKRPWQFVASLPTLEAGAGTLIDLTGSPYLADKNQLQWLRVVRVMPDGRYSTPVFAGPFVGWDSTTDLYGVGGPITGSGTVGTPGNVSKTLTGDTAPESTALLPTQTGYGVSYNPTTKALEVQWTDIAAASYAGQVELNGPLGIQIVPVTVTLADTVQYKKSKATPA